MGRFKKALEAIDLNTFQFKKSDIINQFKS